MRALAWSPDGKLIAAAGRNAKVRVWDSSTGKTVDEFKSHTQRIRELAFSPEGTQLVTASEDRTIRVRDIQSKNEFELETGRAKVFSVAFCHPNYIASGGSDNTIRIWNLTERNQVAVLTGHTGSVAALAVGADVLVSTGYDATVRVWTRDSNIADSTPVPTPRVGALPIPSVQ